MINESHGKRRWVVSPFWMGFTLVLFFGILSHFIFPIIDPKLFEEGMTTLLKDPLYIHDLAERIALLPWSQFELRPEFELAAGVLGFIYKVTGIHKPFMMLPILAALAGVTIRILVSCMNELGVIGRWWPLVLAVLFTVSPTSVSWMIYPHADAFVVPGVMLITWSLMSAAFREIKMKHYYAFASGALLVLLTKTYFAELLLVGAVLSFIIVLIQTKFRFEKFAFFLVVIITFGTTSVLWEGYSTSGALPLDQTSVSSEELPRHFDTKLNWEKLPGAGAVNNILLSLAFTRERYLFERPHGRTNFLPNTHIESSKDALLFIPRAFQLSLFEPLPWRSVDQSLPYKMIFRSVQIEMVFVYFFLSFLILSGRGSFSTSVLLCLAISLPFLFAFGFAMPNIGTVNRYRFPFLILIKMAGLAALWHSSRFKWPGRLLMWIDPPTIERSKKKILFLVPDDVTFLIQRLVMANGAKNAGFDVHVASEDTGVSDKIRELGFTFHKLDLNRGGLNPFADFKPFVRLVLFLAKERPDILQCVSIKPVLYGATAGTIVGLKRIVCLINGMGIAFEGVGPKGKVLKLVATALYKNALALPGIRVIFQNPDDRAYFVNNHLVAEAKTILIRGSGVDREKFPYTPPVNNPEPVILFVGRLLWSKGIRELIEAAKVIKDEGHKFKLVIVGGPDNRNPDAVPQEYLENLNSLGVIDWVGRQKDMPKFYRNADVVCLPTLYKEGLPLTLLEAASTGRPLIATDVPGCREIVRNGENGYLVEPRNIPELITALRALVLNSQLRLEYGVNSSKIVEREFASNIIQGQLVAVYNSLLNNTLPPEDTLETCSITF